MAFLAGPVSEPVSRTVNSQKTNAMRALGQRKIAYEAHAYDPEIKSAAGVAEALGVAEAEVFKTLVLLPSTGRPLLVMVAGDGEVDTRVLAGEIGVKSVRMAPR